MVKAKRLGQTDRSIAVSTIMVLKRVKVSLGFLMVATTMVRFLITKSRAMAHTVGQMERYTQENGSKTKCTGKVSYPGKMERSTRELL